MKNKFFYILSILPIVILASACSSTPKVMSRQTVGVPTYRYAQEPAKMEIADEGRQFNRHVKAMQGDRLAHERTMSAIENTATETAFAKEKGVAIQIPAVTPSAPTASPVAQPRTSFWGGLRSLIQVNGSVRGVLAVQQPARYPQNRVHFQSVGYWGRTVDMNPNRIYVYFPSQERTVVRVRGHSIRQENYRIVNVEGHRR